ncbi:MAG TPA: hypothetical protein PKL78_00400 [Anaerolineales bacterium]|nr:hypothetical protein [Anaerolineales bacterium]
MKPAKTKRAKNKTVERRRLSINLDTLALIVLTTLMTLVCLTILLGENKGIQVRTSLPKDGVVGPYETIIFSFSEPFDPELASDLISLTPVHEGYLEWVDTYTLRFVPMKPYEKGVSYTLKISPGELTAGGREAKQTQIWEFSVREPRIAVLLTNIDQSSLWSFTLNRDAPQQLTDEAIKVMAFDVAPSGDFIVFTSANVMNGIDLWRVDREGSKASIILDCRRDRCTTPVIAPNNKQIAYSREIAGPSPDLPFGSPRTWIFDLESGANRPVYEDQQILGYNPSWSPDSKKLASFDGLSDLIHVIDFETGEKFLLPSNTGGPVTWSPDSKKLLYTALVQTEGGGRTQVHLADLSINKTAVFIGEKDDHDYSYYSLAWSSREDMAVISLRLAPDQLTQSLWVFNPSLLDGIIIAGDPEYTYNSPQWDPWGSALLYQQFKLRGQNTPEIVLWMPGYEEPRILTEGLMPHWLP